MTLFFGILPGWRRADPPTCDSYTKLLTHDLADFPSRPIHEISHCGWRNSFLAIENSVALPLDQLKFDRGAASMKHIGEHQSARYSPAWQHDIGDQGYRFILSILCRCVLMIAWCCFYPCIISIPRSFHIGICDNHYPENPFDHRAAGILK